MVGSSVDEIQLEVASGPSENRQTWSEVSEGEGPSETNTDG